MKPQSTHQNLTHVGTTPLHSWYRELIKSPFFFSSEPWMFQYSNRKQQHIQLWAIPIIDMYRYDDIIYSSFICNQDVIWGYFTS